MIDTRGHFDQLSTAGVDRRPLMICGETYTEAILTIIRLQKEVDKLKTELAMARGRTRENRPYSDMPTIEGWKVQLSPDGYFRAHKSINGRLYSAYIGKRLDMDAARAKVKAREEKLSAHNQDDILTLAVKLKKIAREVARDDG